MHIQKTTLSHFPTSVRNEHTSFSPIEHVGQRTLTLQAAPEGKSCLSYTWQYIKDFLNTICECIKNIFEVIFCCNTKPTPPPTIPNPPNPLSPTTPKKPPFNGPRNPPAIGVSLPASPGIITPITHGLVKLQDTCFGNSCFHMMFESIAVQKRCEEIITDEYNSLATHTQSMLGSFQSLPEDSILIFYRDKAKNLLENNSVLAVEECKNISINRLKNQNQIIDVLYDIAILSDADTRNRLQPLIKSWQRHSYAMGVKLLRQEVYSKTSTIRQRKDLQEEVWSIPHLYTRLNGQSITKIRANKAGVITTIDRQINYLKNFIANCRRLTTSPNTVKARLARLYLQKLQSPEGTSNIQKLINRALFFLDKLKAELQLDPPSTEIISALMQKAAFYYKKLSEVVDTPNTSWNGFDPNLDASQQTLFAEDINEWILFTPNKFGIYKLGAQVDAPEYLTLVLNILQLDKEKSFGLQANSETFAEDKRTKEKLRFDKIPSDTPLTINIQLQDQSYLACKLVKSHIDPSIETLDRSTTIAELPLGTNEEGKMVRSYSCREEGMPPKEFIVTYLLFDQDGTRFSNRKIKKVLEEVTVRLKSQNLTKAYSEEDLSTFRYKPVVIISHTGSMESGHYVAYKQHAAKNKRVNLGEYDEENVSLTRLNDNAVVRRKQEEVEHVQKTAYLVLYRLSPGLPHMSPPSF